MTPLERTAYLRIQRRAAQLQPDLARRLLAAYEEIRKLLTETELARAIQDGTLDGLLNEVIVDRRVEAALGSVRDRLDRAVLDAGRAAAADLPSAIGSVFNVLNPRVIDAARSLDSQVIRDLSDDVRETVRQRAVAGLQDGLNPRAVARGVRSSVGLAPAQEQWVRNFRQQIETGDRAALRRVLGRGTIRTPSGDTIQRSSHAGGQGLGARELDALQAKLGKERIPQERIDRMVEAYERRLRALNAEAVSRSAMLDAQRQGQRLSWEDAIDRGVVARSDLRRSWIAVGGPSGDGRNRPEHLELHGTVVLFDQRYPNGEMVPGESSYGCRCAERYFVVRVGRAAAA